MSYLDVNEFEKILKTVEVLPVSSEKLGDLAQFSFDTGIAQEYASFMWKTLED